MAATAVSGLESPGASQSAVQDVQALALQDETFDAVIANHMLYHVPDRERALIELRRVPEPGG